MNVRIHPEAEQELYEAAAWYERRDAGLGLRFLQAYENALRRVQDESENLPAHDAATQGRDMLSEPICDVNRLTR